MYFAALKTNGKIIIFKLGANFVRLAGVSGEAMVAPGPVSQRDTVEYVNFLLIVGRMTLPQYWRHLNNLLDGTVLVHSMARVRAPGYTNFKVVFQENFSTGHHQVTSCSAQELVEDKCFSYVYFPVFAQLFKSEQFKNFVDSNVFDMVVSCLTPEEPKLGKH